MTDASLKAPKGTRDLTGAEADAFARLEDTARRLFHLHGFSEIRTPIFEPVELFSRAMGETSDVVEKEMFTFTDRGERTFALRPEGTAGVVRHFIEQNLAVKGGVHRLFYAGPMFRAERPQAGRYRQFWQIGSEHFGAADAAADADTVWMAARILQGAGLSNFTVQVNSIGCKNCRPAYREKLTAYLTARQSELTEESVRRMKTNPLRVLDSKADGPKLADAPAMVDHLCEACRAHHTLFLELMTGFPVPVESNKRLVRGLDYYSRTVFEFVSPDLGAQSALAAGGRYDDLVEQLGGPIVPAVGFALGMDRVIAAAATKSAQTAAPSRPLAMVIPLFEGAVVEAFRLSVALRSAGVVVPPVVPGRKLKNQLSAAVDIGANWAILIGEDEIKAREATVKDLTSREQFKVALSAVVDTLSTRRPLSSTPN